MKYFGQLVLGTLISFSILFVQFNCGKANDERFENAIEVLKSYKYGYSRAALSDIEALVMQITNEKEKKEIASQLVEILETDASIAAKQFVCQQLRVIGNEEQIPVLQELLLDEETSDIALFALEEMPSTNVDAVFRDVLLKMKGKYKISVINALGKRRDKNAVKKLAPLLSDPDLNVSEAAGLALGKIGTVEAGNKLKNRIDKSNNSGHTKMSKYYLMCANKLYNEGEKEAALNMYRELSVQNKNLRVQMLARNALVPSGEIDASVFVIEALKSEDAIIRRLAMKMVKDTPGEKATLEFCKILDVLPPSNQVLLLLALSDRGDSRALPTMIERAKSKNDDLRITAFKSIAVLGDETVIPLLLNKIVEGSGEEIEVSRNSLYLIIGTGVDDKISEMVYNDNVEIRIEAIKAISARNIVGATPILLELLKDPNERIRIECWKGLTEIGSDKDLPQMIASWIEIANKGEIEIAEDAVVKVCRNATTKHKYTTEIQASIGKKQSKEIKISLINALGRIGAYESLPLLQNLLYDKDHDIQTAALRGLSIWPTDGPLEDLRHVAMTTTNQTQKVIALRGYIYLIGLATNRASKETLDLYNDAMNLSWRSEEKKLVLTGYSHVQSFDALKAVEKYLLDKELKNEAAAAALIICDDLIERSINRAEKGRIALILDMINQTSEVESMRSEAQNIATRMEE